ncbi:uncharacterized protein ELE39_001011 [Cryptosporidium sp. chipmunk genotype I]|uniref:uncharacterized protein n=1 Tax=Cryptosporidium sp. chipmunk genotype I TaxID=1280935 RepID=UPI00351A84BD|nr:hypothetical protein ELE39_001011 [Cryptosporidium sp. chipmunk genotype I]
MSNMIFKNLLWSFATFLVFVFKGINYNHEILNQKIEWISFLHAQGGENLASSLSELSIKAVDSADSGSGVQSLPTSWFEQKLGINRADYLQSVGISNDLTSQHSCTRTHLSELLRELKDSLQKLILNTAQVLHYEKNNSEGKYVTSSFNEYLTEKKQEVSRLNTNVVSLLDKIFKCLMLLNLKKYARKRFTENSVNCNPPVYFFLASLIKMSKEVLLILQKLENQFKKKYKSSIKDTTATFDHSTLSSAAEAVKVLIDEQNKISKRTKDKKKMCKMYLVLTYTDIPELQ